jgi:hypothetical protein
MALKLDTTRAKASPARETPAQLSRAIVDEQVRHVVDLMADDAWGPDLVPALAQDWGCTEAAVHDRAAQAARYLRLLSDQSEREALRVRWLRRLDAIAMTGDNRDSVAAIREGRELGAMTAAIQLAPAPQVAFRTAREALAWAESAIPRLREQAAAEEQRALPAETEDGNGD